MTKSQRLQKATKAAFDEVNKFDPDCVMVEFFVIDERLHWLFDTEACFDHVDIAPLIELRDLIVELEFPLPVILYRP